MSVVHTKGGNPLRVLHVLPCDDFAGAELLVASYVEQFDKAVVDVEVATLAAPGPIAERLRAAGVKTHSLGGSAFTVAAARLQRLLSSQDFDVVNAHGFKTSMVGRVFVRGLRRRAVFITSVHGLHVTEMEQVRTAKGRLVLAAERFASPLVDAYEVNTRGGVEFLAAGGINRNRLHYIPNGIDAREWRTRAERSADGRVPMIACVARFVARKRHVDVIHALARLRDGGIRARVVFAGFGPTLESSRELARSLSLEGLVEFRGRVTPQEVASILREADIFCLPSLWEGTVISAMEAMATGLPVVGTAVNGIDEVVVDGETGLLVPPACSGRLAEALRKVLVDPELRTSMGENGRTRVEREFSLSRIVQAKENLYLSLVKRR